jgi:hypothetical protein
MNNIQTEKIRIILKATMKQLMDIEELKQSGVLSPQVAQEYQDIIIDVFRMQRDNYVQKAQELCA